jgi:septin 3/9/12
MSATVASANVVVPNMPVGFETITKQIEKRLLKRGFEFNLMVVGQSGLGKTTLINTLFASQLAESSGRRSPSDTIGRTSDIKVVSHVVKEGDVRLKLNIIDTPGYGDQVNNEKCWDPITKYIKDQHSHYLRKELTAQRDRYLSDTRVHCVLFFIQPTGHGLKPLDITVLKRLTEIANVVPVIAKSDSMTLAERENFKEIIQEEFQYHKLRIYPYDAEDHDDFELDENNRIRKMIPFAVVGSEITHNINGNLVRGRRNRFGGIVVVDDPNHCEFVQLRDFLLSTHLQDLIDTTAHIHYEAFRAKQLLALKENSSHQQQQQQQQTAATKPQPPVPVPGPSGSSAPVGTHTPSAPPAGATRSSSLTGPFIPPKKA